VMLFWEKNMTCFIRRALLCARRAGSRMTGILAERTGR